METRKSKLVIIPTYNEIENVEKIIRAVFALEGGYHILIIDDGSPDGTAKAVQKISKEFPDRLFLIERAGKQGLGTAYITGFKWALGKRLRLHLRDGCRLLPRSQRSSPPPCRLRQG